MARVLRLQGPVAKSWWHRVGGRLGEFGDSQVANREPNRDRFQEENKGLPASLADTSILSITYRVFRRT